MLTKNIKQAGMTSYKNILWVRTVISPRKHKSLQFGLRWETNENMAADPESGATRAKVQSP